MKVKLNRHQVSVGIVAAIALFVAVATVVAAIRQDSWGPVWATGWMPAVLVSYLRRADTGYCRLRLRGR